MLWATGADRPSTPAEGGGALGFGWASVGLRCGGPVGAAGVVRGASISEGEVAYNLVCCLSVTKGRRRRNKVWKPIFVVKCVQAPPPFWVLADRANKNMKGQKAKCGMQ